MAKMIREASKKIGNTLRAEDLAVAVENWKETGSITKAIKAVVDWIEWRPVSGHVSETFYRKMNQSDYDYLRMTDEVPPTGETFISPTKSFTEDYDGVLVRFEMKQGTTSLLEGIGVSNGDRAILAKTVYPNMPHVSGVKWTKNFAFFKAEGSQINIGLGKGKALELFNRNILKYEKVE